MSVSDDLNAMADYMEKVGQCKNRSVDDNGSVCIIGSVNRMTGEYMQIAHLQQGREIFDLIEEFTGQDVVSFNYDHDGPTTVQMLRDCAIKNQPDEA